MASLSEQEEFEFRRRAEAEAAGTSVAPKKPSLAGEAGRALYNLPRSAVDLVHGAETQFGPEGIVAQTVMHPVQTFDKAKDFAHQAAEVLRGGAQRVRDMSPAGMQGTAPHMDTTAYDKFAGENYDKYGTVHNVAKTIADDPAPLAAMFINPALKGAGIASDAARTLVAKTGAKMAPVAAKAADITTAGRRAQAASDTMRGEAAMAFKESQATAAAEAAAAADKAARAAALAQRSRATGKALDTRRAAEAAAAAPPELAVGEPRHLSEIGDSVRQPAVERQSAISDEMRAADDKYRTAMQQVADDRAKAGVGVSDTNVAKLVIRQSKEIVQPNPVKRPSVGSVPADNAGGKLHNMLLDVLQPKEVPLTIKEAAQARKAGIEVNVQKDGSLTRTIKPDLKGVEDFRRYLGKVLYGSIEGFEAINRVEAGNMYRNVTKVIDKYVGGAHSAVQKNWREAKVALEPYEKVRAGQSVVGTQGNTGVASVPASSIPGRMLAGGRDTLKQTAAVAGEAPVAASLRSQVQNALVGAKTADAAEALVRPGGQLADAVHADPALEADVSSYLAKMRRSEAAAARADALAQRTATASKRAGRLDKTAEGLQAKAKAAVDVARENERQLASLEIADPKDVGRQYTEMLNRAHKAGTIDTAKYQRGLKLAQQAEKAFKTKETRAKWLRYAPYAVGVGAAGAIGVDIAHTLGN